MFWLFRIVILAAIGWGVGFYYFTIMIPHNFTSATTKTDGLVVLTGGKGRIEHGLQLYANGKADKLLVSGVGSEDEVGTFITRHASKETQGPLSKKMTDITLDKVADSTYSNAVETGKWARKYKLKTIRVVTSEFHMPRSLMVLQKAMPEQTLIADAVRTDKLNLDAWWTDKQSALMLVREYHKFLFVAVVNILL